jgi:hypothetical protein
MCEADAIVLLPEVGWSYESQDKFYRYRFVYLVYGKIEIPVFKRGQRGHISGSMDISRKTISKQIKLVSIKEGN